MLFFAIGCLVMLVGIIAVIGNLAVGNKGAALGAGICAPIIAAVLILISCARSIPAGHTGVVTTFGKVEDYTLSSGLNFTAPWQKIVKMDNRVQKETVTLMCFSSDIQEVVLTYTVNYQIRQQDAMTIYSTIGKNYYEVAVAPNIAESVKIVTAKYTAENLVGSRTELAMAIEEDLRDKLAEYNIELKTAAIEDMDFTDAFTNAVEEKQVATQKKLTAATEAERKMIEAQAEADIRKIDADAEAYEMLAKAEAEAASNKKISESLTDALIDYAYANNWDGTMPMVMTGDGEMRPVFNIN